MANAVSAQDKIKQKQFQDELMKRVGGDQGLGGIGSNQGGGLLGTNQGGSSMGGMANKLGDAIPGPVGMGMKVLGKAGDTLSNMVTAPFSAGASMLSGMGNAGHGIAERLSPHNDMSKMLAEQIARMNGGQNGIAGVQPGALQDNGFNGKFGDGDADSKPGTPDLDNDGDFVAKPGSSGPGPGDGQSVKPAGAVSPLLPQTGDVTEDEKRKRKMLQDRSTMMP